MIWEEAPEPSGGRIYSEKGKDPLMLELFVVMPSL